MDPRSLRIYRLLLLLLPADLRTHRAELEQAFEACLDRERTRLGSLGSAFAWCRGAADVVAAAVALRLDARRRRNARRDLAVPKGDAPMSSLWQEVRYAARMMRRAPGFSAVVVLTLALAIGAITSIFSVVNGVLLRSLPFPEPDRLVILYEGIPKALSGPIGFSAPDFKGFEERVRSFTAIAAFGNKEYELSGVDQPERISAARVSAALFDVLGVPPALGRPFSREEDEARKPVAVLSDGLWRQKFGADPSIIGRAVVLDRQPYTVVGVMPRRFVFPNRGPLFNNIPAELFVPISFTNRELTGFGSMYNNSVVARLNPGVTTAQADAEVRTIAERLVTEIYPPVLQQMGFNLSASAVPLRNETVGRIETVLYVLLAAIAGVLLIACADVANLMLTRAAARDREMAVRSALGAGRARLMRQLLIETGLLACTGGVLGVFFAHWATKLLISIAPPTLPRLHEISIDVRVLAFASGVSIAAALLCGLVPALETSRRLAGDGLKEGARGSTSGARQRRVFGTLVIAQFALAVVLLAAGGLLIRSFSRLMAVNPGFRADHVLTLGTSLPGRAYPSAGEIRSFYMRLLDRVDALPGIAASATATDLPLSVRERRSFTIEAQPSASATIPHVVAHDWVMGRYFEAIGITLVRGRFLSDQDHSQAEPVVVVNQTMAARFWPGQESVGQRIAWGGARNHGPWMRIVGIVGDVKQGPLNTETFPQTYQPWLQVADAGIADNVVGALRALKLIVRTQADPYQIAGVIRAQIRELDPSLPVAQIRTLDAIVSSSAAPQRFNTVLLGSFAAVAMLLAALGIAGVLATSVTRRTQEIGVRLALGAQRTDLLRMVIRQGMTLAVAGVALGLPVALLSTRLISSLLFGVGSRDPATFAAVAALLLTVALVACYVPARRATRVDPIVALRCD